MKEADERRECSGRACPARRPAPSSAFALAVPMDSVGEYAPGLGDRTRLAGITDEVCHCLLASSEQTTLCGSHCLQASSGTPYSTYGLYE